MGYGNNKVAVNLRTAEKYNALIETQADGKEVTYYPRGIRVHWVCERLEVRQAFEYRDKDAQGPSKLRTYVVGTARLNSDYDLSVIGEPKNKTVTVAFSMRPDDSLDLLKEEPDDDDVLGLSEAHGRAHLGFNRADWETRSPNEWWLECRVHSSALQPLIDAISSGTLADASLSVRLHNLFSDEGPYVPFSSEVKDLRGQTTKR